MTRPNPSTFIVGAGPVATAIAASLRRGGVPVLGLWARSAAAARAAAGAAGVAAFSSAPPDLLLDARVVILAVRDAAIPEVTARLLGTGLISPRHILLHNAGSISAADAMPAAAGQVAGRGTLHPLRAIVRGSASGAPQDLSLRGTTFGIEGDEAGAATATALALAMGGQVLPLSAAQMGAYHAAAAMASNYVVALVAAAAEVLAGPDATADQRAAALGALLPLTSGAIANLGAHGLPAGLSGAVRRGDAATVRKHLAAVHGTPEIEALYRQLARRALAIARALPDGERPGGDALGEIAALLG
jgi:predicted short-subunit dehydrogenase-like oxidoreductase (DUF2520 family)